MLAAPGKLKASGATRSYEVEVAGKEAVFRFTQVAGCRYRLTAEPGSLPRPILRLGRAGEEPLVRVDAGEAGKPAVHVFDAERDASMEVRIGGFSAQTGKGRVRLETLGPGDERTKPHRRYLAPGGKRARVGELLVGATNAWELVVEEGAAYQITPTRGSAGRVRLVVHGWDGEPIGDSADGGAAWVALPPVRFRVPPRPTPDAEGKGPGRVQPIRLVVSAVLDGGGTYGVKLRPLGPEESVEAPAVAPPPTVERGPVEGQPTTFRAGPGDVALLYVPSSPNRTQRVEMLRGKRWIHLQDMGLGGSARSQENALMVWFRPYYPGTYRFVGVPAPPPSKPQMTLHDRASLGSAPIHMGTGADPTVRARLASSWTLVGLGVCMPGWDYLYVCVHAPNQGVAMRVRDAAGKVVRTRSASARTISPGLGPSLRFRVRRPGIYRLEARNARKRIVRPLLRRASN
ncbi:MAG: hypothetical protein QNJ90_06440 [Planctomycetota bacterium]|nr:hypothetical protein [Planctomycetota bacterium]